MKLIIDNTAQPRSEAAPERCRKCNGTGDYIAKGRRLGSCYPCNGTGKLIAPAAQVAPQIAYVIFGKPGADAAANWADFAAGHGEKADVVERGCLAAKAYWRNICSDIRRRIERDGALPGATFAMLERAVERERAWAERDAAETAAVRERWSSGAGTTPVTAREPAKAADDGAPPPAYNFPAIFAAFQRVMTQGIKRMQMTSGEMVLRGETGEMPDSLRITVVLHKRKMAFINNGRLRWKIGAPQAHREAVIANLTLIEADPIAAIRREADYAAERIATAEREGRKLIVACGCCGIHLTDPVSRKRGIGPICAAKWGLLDVQWGVDDNDSAAVQQALALATEDL